MKKMFIISMGIALVTAIIAGWFLVTTTGDIPHNWNIHGEVTSYGSPWYIITFPITSILVTLLLYFLPRIDPKGENIRKSGPILQIVMLLLAILMFGIQMIIIAAVNGADILQMNTFISLLLGLLFILIGYYMPRIKPNYMVGIRTPWTLHNEDVWKKTHEKSGRWFILSGILYLGGMFLKAPYSILIPTALMLVIMVGIVIYSYILFKENKKNEKK